MAGNQDKIVGKTKESLGKLTGDEDLEAEGKVQHASGKVQKVAVKVKTQAQALKNRISR